MDYDGNVKIGGDKMNKVNAYIAAGAIVVVLLGSAIETSESMPDNAIVYADNISKTYYGKPSFENKLATLDDNSPFDLAFKYTKDKSIRKMSVGAARQADYQPDKASVNNGDFIGETHSLIYVFFQRVGLLPRQPRWNPDGTWNW